MTSSTSDPDSVYVWTWLPGTTEPVAAGAIRRVGDRLHFGYARSYLERHDAISLYAPELPVEPGWIEPRPGLTIAGAIRDGSPDAWGRGVIEARLGVDENSLTEQRYMLASGTNRLGAIDFQERPDVYVPRVDGASLDELHEAAARLQDGLELSPSLADALIHGTTIGGARPKVLIRDEDGVDWIAKLSSSSDKVFSVPNAEGASLELARRAGLTVPDSPIGTSLGREVLLVRRFDREPDGRRHHVVSGLTMAQEDEHAARYVTYPALLDVLREHGDSATTPGRDLFERIAFNIAISNSDAHARNHAAFWDGQALRLTPAYDLAPGPRSGETATQVMSYTRTIDGLPGERASNFATLVDHCGVYDLETADAREIVDRIVDVIETEYEDAAEMNRMPSGDRARMFGRQFVNPGTLHGYRDPAVNIPLDFSDTGVEGNRLRGRTSPASNSGSFKATERSEGPGIG
ncbi:MAG: HipA domain-containing protein [Nocardioidaceae bacterium]|nr:HipA domain-containing protein [Nocardioidaceae bacterium]